MFDLMTAIATRLLGAFDASGRYGVDPDERHDPVGARVMERQNAADARSRYLPEPEIRRAVRELQSYSDAELNELGLSRAGIEDAVRHGRPGFESDQPKAA